VDSKKRDQMTEKKVARLLGCWILSWQLAFAQAVPKELNIQVVQGEGSVNRTGGRAAQDPIVRVCDQDGKPVPGAAVVFTLPTSGATGEFTGSGKDLTVMTDEKGLATAHGLKVNAITGKLQIHVSASYKGQTSRTLITAFTMNPEGTHHGGSGKWIALVAIIGGAAAGGVLAASRKSNNSAPGASSPGGGAGATPSIVLTPGSSTVGAPPH
jgi:hypothetical protein